LRIGAVNYPAFKGKEALPYEVPPSGCLFYALFRRSGRLFTDGPGSADARLWADCFKKQKFFVKKSEHFLDSLPRKI
jgi:hypothetical protein